MATNRLITMSAVDIYIGTTTNVGNAYTSGSPPVGGYASNILYACTFNATNTGASTLDGYTIQRNGAALVGGEIGVNSTILLLFTGILFQLMNYATVPPGTVLVVTATSPVVSSGGTSPNISLPAATTSVDGYLVHTDWNTFNGKVSSVTGTAPITSTGGVTPVIGIPVATSSVDGYLSHTDWGTFNGKQNALGYTAANDAAVVHLAGTETVTGAKTFSASNTIFQSIGFGGSTPVTWSGSGFGPVLYSSNCSIAPGINYFDITNNGYYTSGWKYVSNGRISTLAISIDGSQAFYFQTAPSGTAGAAAPLTNIASIDPNGNGVFQGIVKATSFGTPTNALGTVGSTATCDFTKSAFNTFTLTTATNCTISFTAPANPCDVTVIVSAPITGTVPTQTWPATVNGSPFSVTTLGKRTINKFFYDGSRYWFLSGVANQT